MNSQIVEHCESAKERAGELPALSGLAKRLLSHSSSAKRRWLEGKLSALCVCERRHRRLFCRNRKEDCVRDMRIVLPAVPPDMQALPFQLHLVMLFGPSPSRTWLERLAQQRFGFGLHLPEQHKAIFVEFLAAGLGLDGGDAVLDFAEVVDDLTDAQGSRLVDSALLVNKLK